MIVPRIVRWLELLGTKATNWAPQDRWVNAPCPLAPWRHRTGKDANPSFGVRSTNLPGITHVKCFACGFRGSQWALLQELKRFGAKDRGVKLKEAVDMLDVEAAEAPLAISAGDYETASEEPQRVLVDFEESWREELPPAWFEDEVHPYLAGREMSVEVARALDVRFDERLSRVVFPIRDFNGRLRGLHGRSVLEGAKPPYKMYRGYRCPACKEPVGVRVRGECTYCVYGGELEALGNNPMVWFGEHWVDFSQPVVMVESVFDLARVFEVYRNVVAPLSASFQAVDYNGKHDAKIMRMAGAQYVLLMFDADEAGQRGAAKVKAALRDSHVVTVPLPEGTDPGAMDSDEIRTRLRDHDLSL